MEQYHIHGLHVSVNFMIQLWMSVLYKQPCNFR